MLNGCPCFPGVRDVFDQLDKIFRVVGTPTEEVVALFVTQIILRHIDEHQTKIP